MPQEDQAQKENKKKEGVKEVSAEYSIRTMRADLARLRLSEGKQERKKIIALQEDQHPVEKTKEPEVFQPEQTAPAIESVLAQKGLERKSATLLKGQVELKQNINALNKKENQVNQEIAKINKQKKLVRNEDQIKELDRQKQESLDRKQEAQINKAKYQKQLEETEKELQGISKKEEVKIKAPIFKKELSDIERVEQAKKRLGQLTHQQEKREEKQDSAFRESLETRWEGQQGKKIPPDIEAMPIKPVKEYPHKPTKETRKSRRIVIVTVSVLLIVLTGAFLFWFFTKGPSLPPSPLPEPPVSPIQPEQPGEVEEIEPTPSITLLSTDREEIIEIQDNVQMADEIKKSLAQAGAQSQDTLVRLLFKNTSQNSFVSLPNFFQTFEIEAPEGLLEKLENYTTLFIYSYDGIERFGFVAKIKQGENIEAQMRKWEETIEPDINSLLAPLGNQGSAGTNIFRQAQHNGISFRYLSMSQQDFGICWAINNERLIFTTSGKTMLKAIDVLQAMTEKEIEGQHTVTSSIDKAWTVYTDFKRIIEEMIKSKDLEKYLPELEKLSYNPEFKNIEDYNKFIEDCITMFDMSRIECEAIFWQILEGFMGLATEEKLEKSDFKNIEEDARQMILSTDLQPREEGGYSKYFLYFVKNSKNELLILLISSQEWDYEGAELEAATKDSDQDGLFDQEEACTGASQYDPSCIKTNSNLKDTDGDGWWDGIEIAAETDPNNINDYPRPN